MQMRVGTVRTVGKERAAVACAASRPWTQEWSRGHWADSVLQVRVSARAAKTARRTRAGWTAGTTGKRCRRLGWIGRGGREVGRGVG